MSLPGGIGGAIAQCAIPGEVPRRSFAQRRLIQRGDGATDAPGRERAAAGRRPRQSLARIEHRGLPSLSGDRSRSEAICSAP